MSSWSTGSFFISWEESPEIVTELLNVIATYPIWLKQCFPSSRSFQNLPIQPQYLIDRDIFNRWSSLRRRIDSAGLDSKSGDLIVKTTRHSSYIAGDYRHFVTNSPVTSCLDWLKSEYVGHTFGLDPTQVTPQQRARLKFRDLCRYHTQRFKVTQGVPQAPPQALTTTNSTKAIPIPPPVSRAPSEESIGSCILVEEDDAPTPSRNDKRPRSSSPAVRSNSTTRHAGNHRDKAHQKADSASSHPPNSVWLDESRTKSVGFDDTVDFAQSPAQSSESDIVIQPFPTFGSYQNHNEDGNLDLEDTDTLLYKLGKAFTNGTAQEQDDMLATLAQIFTSSDEKVISSSTSIDSETQGTVVQVPSPEISFEDDSKVKNGSREGYSADEDLRTNDVPVLGTISDESESNTLEVEQPLSLNFDWAFGKDEGKKDASMTYEDIGPWLQTILDLPPSDIDEDDRSSGSSSTALIDSDLYQEEDGDFSIEAASIALDEAYDANTLDAEIVEDTDETDDEVEYAANPALRTRHYSPSTAEALRRRSKLKKLSRPPDPIATKLRVATKSRLDLSWLDPWERNRFAAAVSRSARLEICLRARLRLFLEVYEVILRTHALPFLKGFKVISTPGFERLASNRTLKSRVLDVCRGLEAHVPPNRQAWADYEPSWYRQMKLIVLSGFTIPTSRSGDTTEDKLKREERRTHLGMMRRIDKIYRSAGYDWRRNV